jgi:hypothetical protein
MCQQPPSARQVALGLFIVGQLFFLVSANFIGVGEESRTEMVPAARQAVEAVAPGWTQEKGHAWYLTDQLARANNMWAQASEQLQNWALFAPGVSRECVFPALEVHWGEDARELILSENEPVQLDHYFRAGNFRLRRYENSFVIALVPEEDETEEQTKARLGDKIRTHVADYKSILLGYMAWRLRIVLADRSGRPRPHEIILVLRRYHIVDHEDAPPYWQGPYSMPLARWDLKEELDWFDPVSGRFQKLR